MILWYNIFFPWMVVKLLKIAIIDTKNDSILLECFKIKTNYHDMPYYSIGDMSIFLGSCFIKYVVITITIAYTYCRHCTFLKKYHFSLL